MRNVPALLQALQRLAILRWLGAAFCALAMLCASAASASALERVQTKTRVWGFELAAPLNICSNALASAEQRPRFSPSQSTLASASPHAARAAPKLLNPGIKVTPNGLQHVIERHTHSGIAKFAGKSKFNTGEDVVGLIESATQQRMVQQANGNFARTFDVGRNIGFDRNVGAQTSWMTVITRADGSLVTAFPGLP